MNKFEPVQDGDLDQRKSLYDGTREDLGQGSLYGEGVRLGSGGSPYYL